MKIVKFDNGTFGVRLYWFFGWHFANFCVKHCAERVGSAYFHQAQTSSKALALSVYNKLSGKTAKYKTLELEQ